jgi:hypothetical protein
MITQEFLKTHFDYKDGYLYWKNNRKSNKVKDKKAGCLNINGYYNLTINYKSYKMHRLIFMWHFGFLPNEIDHIDGNPLNNQIENLRAASRSQNQQNKKIQKNNTSGFKGVYKHKDKWRVRLMINKKSKSFGLYDDIELAQLVAIEARNKYHGEFARHN